MGALGCTFLLNKTFVKLTCVCLIISDPFPGYVQLNGGICDETTCIENDQVRPEGCELSIVFEKRKYFCLFCKNMEQVFFFPCLIQNIKMFWKSKKKSL